MSTWSASTKIIFLTSKGNKTSRNKILYLIKNILIDELNIILIFIVKTFIGIKSKCKTYAAKITLEKNTLMNKIIHIKKKDIKILHHTCFI